MKLNYLMTLCFAAVTTAAVAALGTDAHDTNYVTYDKFVDHMEAGSEHRDLQGYGNDTSACNANGQNFTCNNLFHLSSDGNEYDITAHINCALNSSIGLDFQKATDCHCQATVTDSRSRYNCPCDICPYGNPLAVSLYCSKAFSSDCNGFVYLFVELNLATPLSQTIDLTSATPAPSSALTPVPSSAPTPVPSSAPTPVPSSAPTPAPSSPPTPALSSAPTPSFSSASIPAPSSGLFLVIVGLNLSFTALTF